MNPIIANERNKKKCQKFTPLNKVDDMLDLAGYSRDLFGKKVLEYSFGSGNIIKQIVKRYVEDALTQNIDVNNISSGLSADIYGIELFSGKFPIGCRIVFKKPRVNQNDICRSHLRIF